MTSEVFMQPNADFALYHLEVFSKSDGLGEWMGGISRASFAWAFLRSEIEKGLRAVSVEMSNSEKVNYDVNTLVLYFEFCICICISSVSWIFFFAVGWILVWPESLPWNCVMIIFILYLYWWWFFWALPRLSFPCSCILYFYDFFMYFGLCMVLDFALARMPAFERCGGVSPITWAKYWDWLAFTSSRRSSSSSSPSPPSPPTTTTTSLLYPS